MALITIPALIITLPILMCLLAGNLSGAETTSFTLLTIGGAMIVISSAISFIAYRIGASSVRALLSGLMIFPTLLVGTVITGGAFALIDELVLPQNQSAIQSDVSRAVLIIFLLFLGFSGGLFPLLIGRSSIQANRS